MNMEYFHCHFLFQRALSAILELNSAWLAGIESQEYNDTHIHIPISINESARIRIGDFIFALRK